MLSAFSYLQIDTSERRRKIWPLHRDLRADRRRIGLRLIGKKSTVLESRRDTAHRLLRERIGMKVAFAGVGHWHTPLYLDPLLRLQDVSLIGVSDPDAAVAEALASRHGCRHTTRLDALCAIERPDLVFVLGKHSAMAEAARFLIGERIPFVIEKPAGISAREVEDLAERSEAAGLFAAVPLVFRTSGFMSAIREAAA